MGSSASEWSPSARPARRERRRARASSSDDVTRTYVTGIPRRRATPIVPARFRRLTGGAASSRPEPEHLERLARGAGFVVRPLLLSDDDRLLVTLAGEDHGVLGRGSADGLADRLAAIVDDGVVGAFALARADRAPLDLLEDLRRLLEARVLLRDHEEVRVLRGHLRERGPLRAVALAGTTEDHDELPLRER